jgi:3-oxoacyl-[acyl-carrier protein] reductase
LALVTGASRREGIGAAIALGLARGGWDVAITYWRAYDARMPWGASPVEDVMAQLKAAGVSTMALEADLHTAGAATDIFENVTDHLGDVTALVMAHAESVASSIADTSVESFDRHFAVNARATWLLIREFAARFKSPPGSGRIIALTSDHTVGNLPYGASKGALDRIVLAAARELAPLGVTANVINPGPTETGWMTDAQRQALAAQTPLGRVSTPEDCARLVTWLCSADGGWINGQLLHSNGGFQ